MKDAPRYEGNCPDCEELSAFFDGESANPAEIAAHAAKCPACTAYLNDLKKMDSALKAASVRGCSVTPEISARILAGVRDRVRAEKHTECSRFKVVSFYVMRAAAILLLTGGIGYYLWSESVPGDAEQVPAPRVATVEPSARVPAQIGSLSVSEVSPVSFVVEEKRGDFQNCAVIPETVQHSWAVPEGTEFSLPEKLALASGVPQEKISFRNDYGTLTLTLQCTKEQAVRFVRNCIRNRFQLLSAEQPQPEESRFAGSRSDKIKYSAVFMLK